MCIRDSRITASVVIGEETTICPTWADAVELVNTLPKDGEVGQATIYLLKDLSRYETYYPANDQIPSSPCTIDGTSPDGRIMKIDTMHEARAETKFQNIELVSVSTKSAAHPEGVPIILENVICGSIVGTRESNRPNDKVTVIGDLTVKYSIDDVAHVVLDHANIIGTYEQPVSVINYCREDVTLIGDNTITLGPDKYCLLYTSRCV